jgi:hypothetical protein
MWRNSCAWMSAQVKGIAPTKAVNRKQFLLHRINASLASGRRPERKVLRNRNLSTLVMPKKIGVGYGTFGGVRRKCGLQKGKVIHTASNSHAQEDPKSIFPVLSRVWVR